MESKPSRAPLIVVVGETASGKTALAIELARRFDGEIIAADSRTVYRGMDIGTAKPTMAERAEVPHHLIDVADPDCPITVADFKRLAVEAIDSISARGKLPFLVGGSGLYVDAVLYDFSFAPRGQSTTRQEWQQLSIEALQAKLKEQGIPLPKNQKNPRHLIRSLETNGISGERQALRDSTLIIGLSVERAELEKRVEARINRMFKEGLLEEAKKLADQYGWDIAPMQTIGYREFKDVRRPDQLIEELKAEIKRDTLKYAKRQRTWFGRNKSIHWISQKEEAVDLITTFLNK